MFQAARKENLKIICFNKKLIESWIFSFFVSLTFIHRETEGHYHKKWFPCTTCIRRAVLNSVWWIRIPDPVDP
jgi:hypothetical protein